MSSSPTVKSQSPTHKFSDVVSAFHARGYKKDAEETVRIAMVTATMRGQDPYAVFDMTWADVMMMLRMPIGPPRRGKWSTNSWGKAVVKPDYNKGNS